MLWLRIQGRSSLGMRSCKRATDEDFKLQVTLESQPSIRRSSGIALSFRRKAWEGCKEQERNSFTFGSTSRSRAEALENAIILAASNEQLSYAYPEPSVPWPLAETRRTHRGDWRPRSISIEGTSRNRCLNDTSIRAFSAIRAPLTGFEDEALTGGTEQWKSRRKSKFREIAMEVVRVSGVFFLAWCTDKGSSPTVNQRFWWRLVGW